MQGEAVISAHKKELQDTAKRFASQVGAQFDVRLDFSVHSLQRLDGVLEQYIDLSEVYWSDQHDLLPDALALTAYVGEVFRKVIPDAEWIPDREEDGVPPPHLYIPPGIRLNLMKKSIEILTRSDSPSFVSYYQTVREIVQNQVLE